jgi:hypothetical protein
MVIMSGLHAGGMPTRHDPHKDLLTGAGGRGADAAFFKRQHCNVRPTTAGGSERFVRRDTHGLVSALRRLDPHKDLLAGVRGI